MCCVGPRKKLHRTQDAPMTAQRRSKIHSSNEINISRDRSARAQIHEASSLPLLGCANIAFFSRVYSLEIILSPRVRIRMTHSPRNHRIRPNPAPFNETLQVARLQSLLLLYPPFRRRRCIDRKPSRRLTGSSTAGFSFSLILLCIIFLPSSIGLVHASGMAELKRQRSNGDSSGAVWLPKSPI